MAIYRQQVVGHHPVLTALVDDLVRREYPVGCVVIANPAWEIGRGPFFGAVTD